MIRFIRNTFGCLGLLIIVDLIAGGAFPVPEKHLIEDIFIAFIAAGIIEILLRYPKDEE